MKHTPGERLNGVRPIQHRESGYGCEAASGHSKRAGPAGCLARGGF